MKTQLSLLLALLSALLLTSCGSSRQLARAGEAQRAQLSRQFGIPLTKRDNLDLYAEAATWLGVSYRPGGTSRQGVDCSGLVGNLYNKVYRKQLSRSSQDIAKKDCRRIGRSSLKTGDLVFFNTSSKRRRGINHVGLYLKNGKFIHASTSRGVIISNLQENYYRKAWKQGGRVK